MIWKFGKLDFWDGGEYYATLYLDLGKKLEILIFWGGVFCNFGFGLRKKVGNLEFLGGGGGVFCNFGFGLRKKVGNLEFWDGGGILQLRIWT